MYDQLGERCKSYENSFRQFLPIRMPVILRLDGKSFSTYTKGCKKPIDENLVFCMNETAKYLCKNIQGAQIAFIQSDEITILINNYKELNTQPWFDNNVVKMVSVSAGMASAYFTSQSHVIFGGKSKLATFDSRVFVVPKEDVNNVIYWRQSDAMRNSVQMLARTVFSNKELFKKSNSEIKEMLLKKGVSWEDCPTFQKRGRCIVKNQTTKQSQNKYGELIDVLRSEWVVDDEIPNFSEDKNYIMKYV